MTSAFPIKFANSPFRGCISQKQRHRPPGSVSPPKSCRHPGRRAPRHGASPQSGMPSSRDSCCCPVKSRPLTGLQGGHLRAQPWPTPTSWERGRGRSAPLLPLRHPMSAPASTTEPRTQVPSRNCFSSFLPPHQGTQPHPRRSSYSYSEGTEPSGLGAGAKAAGAPASSQRHLPSPGHRGSRPPRRFGPEGPDPPRAPPLGTSGSPRDTG